MSLDRQGGRRPTRRQREQRAFQLSVAGGGAAVAAAVTGLLAIIGVMGFGPAVIAAIIAVVCFVLFRRTVSGG